MWAAAAAAAAGAACLAGSNLRLLAHNSQSLCLYYKLCSSVGIM
jgi:hypothetical protein